MRRRGFIAFLGSTVLVRSFAAHARQPEGTRRIGVLMLYPENDPQGQLRAKVFSRELEKVGWTVGDNLQINYHWGTGDLDWVRSAAAQVLRQAPDERRSNRPERFQSSSLPAAIRLEMAGYRAWLIRAAI